MHMMLESVSPFLAPAVLEWKEVYIVLQGTQLSIHKCKSCHVGRETIQVAGKLMRSYTLQHAEVGLAPDATHNALIPQTRLAHLIPSVARRRAFEKDPNLFRVVKRHALRLRLETDQFVLAQQVEDVAITWVNRISAGIDIAPPIEERSIPRQVTVPRRRRRQRPQVTTTDLNDTRLIEEQERILREMYPSLARGSQETTNAQASPEPPASRDGAQDSLPSLTITTSQGQDQEAEDIDLSDLAEDVPSSPSSPNPSSLSASHRPTASRHVSSSTFVSVSALDTFQTSPLNFALSGKWAPPHTRTSAQQLRYVRRCMPLLFYDSPRASGVMFHAGKLVRPNFKTDTLDEWHLQPPSYEAHDFPEETTSALSRSPTNASSLSGRTNSPHDSTVDVRTSTAQAMAAENEIEVVRSNDRTSLGPLQKLRSRASQKTMGIRKLQTGHESSPEIEAGMIMLGF